MWDTIESFAEAVVSNWDRPDRGIWEIRGPDRHFVRSKVMRWVAMDSAITLATELARLVDLDRWGKVRDEIRNDVLEHGWNEELQSFVQHYGASHTDAARLMLPMVGFIAASDPRMALTVQRIRQELDAEGLLRRYRTDLADDGIRSEKGVFTMCTRWLAGYLTFAGDLAEARQLLERVLAYGTIWVSLPKWSIRIPESHWAISPRPLAMCLRFILSAIWTWLFLVRNFQLCPR